MNHADERLALRIRLRDLIDAIDDNLDIDDHGACSIPSDIMASRDRAVALLAEIERRKREPAQRSANRAPMSKSEESAVIRALWGSVKELEGNR